MQKAHEIERAHKQPGLSQDFLRQFHQQMFGESWKWASKLRASEFRAGKFRAGKFRRSDKNIGIRFHHHLVAVLPFPDGLGRHARLMANLIVERLDRARFSGDRQNLIDATGIRRDYIATLQAADAR